MRRIIAGLAVSLVLLAPLPAHADVPDPVKRLHALVVPGRGVTISAVTRMSFDGKHAATTRTTRVAEFLKGGGVETDDISTFSFSSWIRSKLSELPEDLESEMLFPTLLIKAGGAYYTSGGALVGKLPLDKKWVRSRWYESSPMDTTVDLLAPGTLRALLATASSTGPRTARGTIYSSKIPGLPLGGIPGERGEKVAWALWFDAKGRVTRLTTTASQRTNDDIMLTISSDLRYTGWGARVTVEPPPEELVVEAEDIAEFDPFPWDLPIKLETSPKRD
ncbi:hypothetical protein [Streptosporangium sp. NPDC048865]|uniref:hypothetical protein n=1 Tax=Streptosporangium sp. NPDC048865 TaxID=3155766 RepID=UPI00343A85B2